MRTMKSRPNGRLVSIRQAEEETGLPQALLRDLIHRGELRAIQPPGKRRVFIVRDDLLAKFDQWVVHE